MLCEHLHPLEQLFLTRGIREIYRGRAWSSNCREWVYFDCYIDTQAVLARMSLADCVHEHVHRGTHDGEERGLVCTQCRDAIMGHYEAKPGLPVISA
jgi:hypothetical protein